MRKDRNGFILIARSIEESEIWNKPAEWLKIWIHILLGVNHKDGKLFKRGEGYFKYNFIAQSCRVTAKVVDNYLQWGRKRGLVKTSRRKYGVVIKVLKYEQYQDAGKYKKHPLGEKEKETEKETAGESAGDTNREKNVRNYLYICAHAFLESAGVEDKVNDVLLAEAYPSLTDEFLKRTFVEVVAWLEKKKKPRSISTSRILNWFKNTPPVAAGSPKKALKYLN